jgi:hypothetical protein
VLYGQAVEGSWLRPWTAWSFSEMIIVVTLISGLAAWSVLGGVVSEN